MENFTMEERRVVIRPEDEPYRILYRNVILRAVEEARGVSLVCGRKENKRHLQREAREWLASDSMDLRAICLFAGVDFERLNSEYERKYK